MLAPEKEGKEEEVGGLEGEEEEKEGPDKEAVQEVEVVAV